MYGSERDSMASVKNQVAWAAMRTKLEPSLSCSKIKEQGKHPAGSLCTDLELSEDTKNLAGTRSRRFSVSGF